jgi:hypothetical protein
MKWKLLAFLFVYIFMGLPSAAQAVVISHNYDFDYPNDPIDTRPTANNAAQYQCAWGYSSAACTNFDPTWARNQMSSDAIFFFNGHGNAGMMSFITNGLKAPLIASGTSNPSLSTYNNNELRDLLFALFCACNTGLDSAQYGNLQTIAYQKGVDCSIGWTRTITSPQSDYWCNRFWFHSGEGSRTVTSAAQCALDDTNSLYGSWNNGGTYGYYIKGNGNIYLNSAHYGTI